LKTARPAATVSGAGVADVAFLAALLALTVWIALSIAWSVDPAQSVLELERALALLAGCFAFLVLARRGGRDVLVPALLVAIALGVAIAPAGPVHAAAPSDLFLIGQNGKFGYTANAQGGSISGFAIDNDGSIGLIDADGRTAVVGGGNIDLAVSGNSRYLYQLNGNRSISGFRIATDGHLTAVGNIAGLPASTVGLVAR